MGADFLNIAHSGLRASQKALQTASHNISNAHTEGYSRQKVSLQSNTPIASSGYVEGTGVKIGSIKRMHDQYLEKRVQNTVSEHNYNEERKFQLAQLEDIFNEVNSEGLNKIMNNFFNSFRELSKQPENETVRSIVRENARIVVNDFRRARESLQTISNGMDSRIEGIVRDANTIMEKLAKLNVKIAEIESVNGETGDLRDKRDLAVKQLSEMFKINTYEDNRGHYIVSADGVGTLVYGGSSEPLAVGAPPLEEGENAFNGRLEIYFERKPNLKISPKFMEGKLGGIFKTRHAELAKLKNNLDRLAYEMTHTVNAIHQKGFANKNLPIDQNGRALASDLKSVIGIDFFKPLDQIDRASEFIDLSDAVKEDLSNIVTAFSPNSPGDNRIAIAISKLQHEKVLENGTASFEESFLKSIGDIGIASGKAQIDAEHTNGILAQTIALREQVAGVSIDEEMADIMRYQQAYDASAKVMRTADEMFDSVLSIMR